ncbi:ribosome biogenesis protein bop1 [Pleuronectes platessa]|uniref:ribosome biogenesis protein bop1 n=1 Tax=Pleuronectes platessa TaxID=8262 RepID=UPI00232A3488|nr:ribosome biogenesis protein bop1 [Pleuronectes platessa]XP_053302896.1 ribosome biogenesis protein bop1 [Pleuronectes platessa]
MEGRSSNMRSNEQKEETKKEGMKKVQEKTKKRSKEEEEEEEEEIFNLKDKPALEGEDGDLSDSEDSVYSGLEDSGSDSDDDDDDEEDELILDSDQTQQTPEGKKKKKKKKKEGGVTEGEKKEDEYEHDSSDEEDIRNTVGNIPMEWYKDFPHIGYDLDGKKILKPIRNKDELDDFLDKMENPDYWRTVHDKQTGSDIVLSDEQVALVNRLQKGQFGDVNFNEYQPTVEFFSNDVMIHPVTNRPADKRSFIPSLIEKEKVSKLVHAIKMGWIKPRRVQEDTRGNFYDLWASEDTSILARHKMHLPAPKIPLPGHHESYNPPPEYLFTEEELALWEQQDPSDRKWPFVPKRFSSLRQVPAFPRFLHERFERCLDLYLCPRQRKMRVNVNPEDLIPKLPKPRDLQPFPTTQSLVYRGHSGLVRSISVSPSGQWLASGSDDASVRFWEVCSSRCLKTIQVGGAVKSITWNPNPSVCLLAVAVDSVVLILSPSLADKQVVSSSERLLSGPQEAGSTEEAGTVTWSDTEGEELNQGIRLKIQHPKAVHQVAWHAKGDYLASVMPDHSSHLQVFIHQLSKRRSQNPFRKNKGLVQCVSFHPVRPYFFVATQRSVRIYNLVKQEMTKKLQANSKWISSMAVHPGGDHVICGSYDCRLSWFDLDLSTKPYKMLRHHKKAVRGVAYHRTYPLFASASDDGSVIVCHGTVYNDLLQNPLIVPVKVLRGHVITHDLGVLDVTFHPTQPWVFSSGADATIRLFT